MREINKTNSSGVPGALSKFTKADWYCATGDCGWSGDDQLDFLPELNMDKYKIQRRLIGGAYSATYMKDVEGNLDKILERNITSMAQRAGLSVNVDLFFDLFASGTPSAYISWGLLN